MKKRITLLLMLICVFSFAQTTTIDFNLGLADNVQFGKTTTVGDFTFTINATGGGDDITYDNGSGSPSLSGSLYDDNLDIGGITKWTIERTDGSEFLLESIDLHDSGAGASTSGTITPFRDGSAVASASAITFNGNKSFTGNVAFQNIDKFELNATDFNIYIDNLVYSEVVVLNTNVFSIDKTSIYRDGNRFASADDSLTIEVYNTFGQKVKNESLANGVYILKITNAQGQVLILKKVI